MKNRCGYNSNSNRIRNSWKCSSCSTLRSTSTLSNNLTINVLFQLITHRGTLYLLPEQHTKVYVHYDGSISLLVLIALCRWGSHEVFRTHERYWTLHSLKQEKAESIALRSISHVLCSNILKARYVTCMSRKTELQQAAFSMRAEIVFAIGLLASCLFATTQSRKLLTPRSFWRRGGSPQFCILGRERWAGAYSKISFSCCNKNIDPSIDFHAVSFVYLMCSR